MSTDNKRRVFLNFPSWCKTNKQQADYIRMRSGGGDTPYGDFDEDLEGELEISENSRLLIDTLRDVAVALAAQVSETNQSRDDIEKLQNSVDNLKSLIEKSLAATSAVMEDRQKRDENKAELVERGMSWSKEMIKEFLKSSSGVVVLGVLMVVFAKSCGGIDISVPGIINSPVDQHEPGEIAHDDAP